MQLPRRIKKIHTEKLSYTASGKVELSNSNLKKNLMFQAKETLKKFLISYQKKAFLIFWKTETP